MAAAPTTNTSCSDRYRRGCYGIATWCSICGRAGSGPDCGDRGYRPLPPCQRIAISTRPPGRRYLIHRTVGPRPQTLLYANGRATGWLTVLTRVVTDRGCGFRGGNQPLCSRTLTRRISAGSDLRGAIGMEETGTATALGKGQTAVNPPI